MGKTVRILGIALISITMTTYRSIFQFIEMLIRNVQFFIFIPY